MKYKVGDKVKLISKRGEYWNSLGRMDEFLGTIQVITHLIEGVGVCFEDPETKRWAWVVNDIDCLVKDSKLLDIYVKLNSKEEAYRYKRLLESYNQHLTNNYYDECMEFEKQSILRYERNNNNNKYWICYTDKVVDKNIEIKSPQELAKLLDEEINDN